MSAGPQPGRPACRSTHGGFRRRQRHLPLQGGGAAAARRGCRRRRRDRRGQHRHHRPRRAARRPQHRPHRLPPQLRGEPRAATASPARPALLVGAGGAGRAVAFALFDLGVRHLLVHDRTPPQAERLVDTLATHFGRHRASLAGCGGGARRGGRPGNATPVGMRGISRHAVCPAAIEARHWLADVIYTPLETELVLAARAREQSRWAVAACACTRRRRPSASSPASPADVARMHRVFRAAAAAPRRASRRRTI